jgi:carboxymethylenebutenolidase
VHEAFGINDEMRKHVARLADMGYVVLMPNLFAEGGARRCLMATFRSLKSGTGRAFADIEAARLTLEARPDTIGGTGIIGFCMGGGFALMSAVGEFDAVSANYGMLPDDLAAALEGACPVIGSYGGSDSSLKGATAKLEAALTRHNVVHDLKEYPTAGHAFLNELPSGPRIMRPIMKVSGMGPNPEAAADAWKRIESFFGEHLAAHSH